MKKIIYTASIITTLFLISTSCQIGTKNQDRQIVDTVHNSKNSLDWTGVYTGTIPCADCEGIQIQLTLNSDETYEKSYLYLGKDDTPFVFSGTFTWCEDGSRITLPRENFDFPISYKVGERKLFQLDIDGNPITGELAEMYILTKKD